MERIKFLKHRGGSWHKGCIAKVILLASLFFIQGCSYLQPEEPLFQGISNRGMIPVSPTNAYVGSNLFLSQQMENSPELYHFIESRGAPHAIRVNERPNRNPELIMYYPREDALYIAELSASRSMYNWIARGPHKIPRYESATLSQPSFDVKGEPLLALFDREIRFPPKYPQTSLKTVAIPKLPEIKPPPKQHVILLELSLRQRKVSHQKLQLNQSINPLIWTKWPSRCHRALLREIKMEISYIQSSRTQKRSKI